MKLKLVTRDSSWSNQMGKRQRAGTLLGVGMLATAAWLTYGYYLRREARAVMDDVRALTLAPDRTAAFEVLRGQIR
jgi:hypothetical protein